MSFVGMTASVMIFNTISRLDAGKPPRHVIGRMISGIVISSAATGLTTLPIATAHLNNIAQFGLIANLALVPLMGILVIPFGGRRGLPPTCAFGVVVSHGHGLGS